MKRVSIVLGLIVIFSMFGFVIAEEGSGDNDLAKIRDRAVAQARVNAHDAAKEVMDETKKALREEYAKKKEELIKEYRSKTNCDSDELESKDKIRCELFNEDFKKKIDEIPQVCRRLVGSDVDNKREACKALINDVKPCEDIEGTDKRECLMKAAGIEKRLEDEKPEVRKEKARQYVIALLGNLRARVEKNIDNIDPEEGVRIMDKIDEINKKVFEGSTKEEIKEMLDELKKMWREAMSESEPVNVDSTDDNSATDNTADGNSTGNETGGESDE